MKHLQEPKSTEMEFTARAEVDGMRDRRGGMCCRIRDGEEKGAAFPLPTCIFYIRSVRSVVSSLPYSLLHVHVVCALFLSSPLFFTEQCILRASHVHTLAARISYLAWPLEKSASACTTCAALPRPPRAEAQRRADHSRVEAAAALLTALPPSPHLHRVPSLCPHRRHPLPPLRVVTTQPHNALLPLLPLLLP